MRYLSKYLAMYAASIAVAALLYALSGFTNGLEFFVPGVLAAVVGVNYARDHHQTPSNRERVQFAVVAGLLSSLVVASLLAFSFAVQGSGNAGLSAFFTMSMSLFVLNAVIIYIGLWLGGWGAMRRIKRPKAATFTGLPED